MKGGSHFFIKMTRNMLNKLDKLKSFFGYNSNTVETVEPEVKPKQESSIDTKVETEKRVCDCCGEQEVVITLSEMFKKDEYGNTIPLFTHPKVTLENGGVYDDVTICDSCFSACETDNQKQYAWLAGKMNSLYKEVQAKEAIIAENNNKIKEIQAEAEEKMQSVERESNILHSEINSLNNTLEMYAQEQELLENQL